jgi:hypothetical protein
MADPNGPKAPGKRLRKAIGKLGPYQSLAVLAVPLCIVEPAKLAALAIAGEGHWFTGTVVILTAYAASLLGVERLFAIVKPKLMKIGWFARLWSWVIAIRDKLTKPLRTVPAGSTKSRRDR